MKTDDKMKIISGNSKRPLSEAIARRMSVYRGDRTVLTNARVERFNDKEIFVEIYDNVRGEDVFIIQPTSHPANDTLMELLIITDALKRASARRITAVIPYFGYARQDRKSAARTPISAKLIANLITTAGVDRVLTILNDAKGFGIGARHITVSTVGILPGIVALGQRKEQFRLALSIHAPSDELRQQLMPVNTKYP
ncbi:MAG: ribose-phosphate diphosphokinase, partial [Hyphomicrobiales bacterium]